MSGIIQSNTVRASGTIAVAAAGLNWSSTILTALTTFTVTVANAGGNKYFINGVQQQTVNLLEGFTYKFDQSDGSNNGHPLRFSTTSGGSHSGGSEYTTGVTTSGTPGQAGAYTQIVVASGAPVLYYYCTAHSGMGGTANTTAETVEAGNGYWIDTTSTTCTITLPSAAAKGDQIVLIDYARTWGTNAITIDSNGLNYQGEADTYTVEYTTSGQSINIVYSDSTKGWIPLEDDVTALEPVAPQTQRGIFAFGLSSGGITNIKNLVSSSGTVATDATGVGTARYYLTGATYGGDKAIFAYGGNNSGTFYSISNLVNNSGVVASDTTGVGQTRQGLGSAGYGTDKAIFAYGYNSGVGGSLSMSNLVTNQGVVGSDVTGVGTAKAGTTATGYGTDLAIFGYGDNGVSYLNQTNKVSNSGVVATDTTGVGTARNNLSAARYGSTGQAIFAYGEETKSMSNLVSSSGVVASDTSGVGTGRKRSAATSYGGDLAIFAYGNASGTLQNVSNKVSNQGVVASDTTGVGTAREGPGAAGYSYSA